MLFRRRQLPTWSETVRILLWPRRNWSRSARYVVYRLWRLRATPHAIALGCACGVFASFTPYLGLHFILAGVLAWVTRGSILASALGTFVGNPLTFPFIWVAGYQLGNWVLGETSNIRAVDLSDSLLNKSFEQIWPLLKPMTIGSMPLGILAGTVAYIIVKKAADSYKNKARKRRLVRGRPAQAGLLGE